MQPFTQINSSFFLYVRNVMDNDNYFERMSRYCEVDQFSKFESGVAGVQNNML